KIDVVHGAEGRVVERVEADGDPVESGRGERPGLPGEERSVGGQCNFYRELGEHRDQAWQVATHERLAAREADLLDAEAGEDAREPRDFLEAEERRLRQEPVARAEYFARHAVHAAEIAAVGDGDA